MKRKITFYAFTLLFLMAITTNGITKESEKDEVVKKQITKVDNNTEVKQTTSNQSDNTNNSDTQTKSATVDLIEKLQSEQSTSSSMSGEKIDWQVISSGGVRGTSSNFILSGTIGQTSIGLGTSTNYQLNSGFWQVFGSQGCCLGTRGNVDFDPGDNTDIADLVYLVAYMFQGGDAPGCYEEADINGSGGIDIADLVALVAYMFQGGIAPSPC